jgi:hypothetical protein
MSIIAHAAGWALKTVGLKHWGSETEHALDPRLPPPPTVPNPDAAMNAAQTTTDSLRMRRGLLGNIYAGALQGQSSQPVTGKTQLGT